MGPKKNLQSHHFGLLQEVGLIRTEDHLTLVLQNAGVTWYFQDS